MKTTFGKPQSGVVDNKDCKFIEKWKIQIEKGINKYLDAC